MLINADFSVRATVTPDQYVWVASPQPGVERMMLDRIGGEKGRATSIVRYAPHSYFPTHEHSGGEEIFVLSGIFSEADQHFAGGWYLRNPPGSSHQPYSDEGAVIFVKLRQMQPDEKYPVRINTQDPAYWRHKDGREICVLFSDAHEHVSLQCIKANDTLFSSQINGAEILVLEGELRVDGEWFPTGSWLRLPMTKHPNIIAGNRGVRIYLKLDNLASFSVRC